MVTSFDALPSGKSNPEAEACCGRAWSLLSVCRANWIRTCSSAALRCVQDGTQFAPNTCRAAKRFLPDIPAQLASVGLHASADTSNQRYARIRPYSAAGHARPLLVWQLADTGTACARRAAYVLLTAN